MRRRPKASLPKPDSAFLQGCSITMLGIGSVKGSLDSGALEGQLIPQWEHFLTKAGADAVTVNGAVFGF